MGSTPAAGPGWEWGGSAEAGSVAGLTPEPSPPGQSCEDLLARPDWRDSWAPDTQSCDALTGHQVPRGDPAPKWASGPGRPLPERRPSTSTLGDQLPEQPHGAELHAGPQPTPPPLPALKHTAQRPPR